MDIDNIITHLLLQYVSIMVFSYHVCPVSQGIFQCRVRQIENLFYTQEDLFQKASSTLLLNLWQVMAH